MDHLVTDIRAIEVLDSRGNPTVEATVYAGNHSASAIVPSGASTGSREAVELRDGDKARYFGKGVLKAISHVQTTIKEALLGQDVTQQSELDHLLIDLDGTANKSCLGANAILSVSMASARLGALLKGQALHQYLNPHHSFVMPVPMMNILNGGAHADNSIDFQEFMIIPVGAASFAEAIEMGVAVFHTLKGVLNAKGEVTAVGDEGGFAPSLGSNKEALDCLLLAIEKAGYKPGQDIGIALDVAASEFYKEGQYHLKGESKIFNSEQLIDYFISLVNQYPILSIEDALDESDWEGWKKLTLALGARVQLVGDDLFVTNPAILQKGIDQGVANSILIKVNQIGTITETLNAISLAQGHGYSAVVSHRSGESEDVFISDLAVATGVAQIKTGSLCRTDRTAKYNQLLRIASFYPECVSYPGHKVFSKFVQASNI